MTSVHARSMTFAIKVFLFFPHTQRITTNFTILFPINMRIWLFVRSFLIGTISGSALISHFTYKQVQTADWEVQYALEDLASLELDISLRGKERLVGLIQQMPKLEERGDLYLYEKQQELGP